MTNRRNPWRPRPSIQMAAGESTTHTNTTTEATVATLTIPAGYLTAGDMLEVLAIAEADSANSTDTHTVNLKIGNSGGTFVSLAGGAADDVVSGDAHRSSAEVIFEAVGTAATVKGMGLAFWSTASAALTATAISDRTNLDTTADLLIEVSVDHSVAHADNQTSVKLFRAVVNGSPV